MTHTVEHLQLEVGIGEYFMHISYCQYGKCTSNNWIQLLWKEISKLPIIVTHRKLTNLALQLENDEYIMKLITYLHRKVGLNGLHYYNSS